MLRMMLLRPLVLLLLVIGLAGAGYYYYISQNGESGDTKVLGVESLPNVTDFSQFTLSDLPSSNELKNDVEGQVDGVMAQGLTLREHVRTILGTEEGKANLKDIQSRTIEYGQYLYCKGVVDEWDNNN